MAEKDYASIIDNSVRVVKDFPKPGINFRDITTMLNNPSAFSDCIEGLNNALKDIDFDVVAGVESRGFIFGAPVALHFNKKFVMIRKPNKLPGEKISYEYKKEYGSDILEVSACAFQKGDKVLVVDDLLATGGSAIATCRLISKCEAIPVAGVFPIELGGLPGRENLTKENVKCISLLITDDA